MAQLPAVTHVALTVSDLSVSVPWYERLLGTKPVLDEDDGDLHHTVYLLPGGTLLALHVADRAELKAWQARLEELGIEHGGIVDAHYGSGLSFRDPDNIALELFAPPG